MQTDTAQAPRFALPMVLGIAAVFTSTLGVWQALVYGSELGRVAWLFIAPLLIVLAGASLEAARRGGWSGRWLVVTLLAVGATVSLSWALWVLALPDEVDYSLTLFWGAAAAYVILAGVATSVGLFHPLVRQLSPTVSRLLGFLCGVVGAVISVPATALGLGFVTIAIIVVIVTGIQWKHSRRKGAAART